MKNAIPFTNNPFCLAAVVTQLLERSLLELEIRGSYPDIGNFIYYQLYCKDKSEEEEAGKDPYKTIHYTIKSHITDGREKQV